MTNPETVLTTFLILGRLEYQEKINTLHIIIQYKRTKRKTSVLRISINSTLPSYD